ncbi:excisionase family DNA-binding protein [Virgibacillus siamensis]|uniref:excisionase family DNA-binding protein n=1 Tax=Virgibacillus siamensis TaxID=480071 RepID=UPI000986F349|nr:excisionase family DNA-binding protein [Virgibacillus siamensis]
MYLTIKETAEYLELDEAKIRAFVLQGKIRAVYDGKQYLINKDQFSTHLEQMEKYREMIQEYLREPLPEDIDVKDED